MVGDSFRAAQPLTLLPLLSALSATPHYGATIVRVYEQRRERRAYALFSVWATLALILSFVVGLELPAFGSFLATLFITWSPWHYTGQNYGIAVMLLGRARVHLELLEKRVLYTAFVASYLFVFLVMHGGDGSAAAAPSAFSYDASRIQFVTLGIPSDVTLPLGSLALAVAFGAIVWLSVRLQGRARFVALLPAVMLVLSQILWFVLPLALRLFEVGTSLAPLDPGARGHYQVYIAIFGHSLQYLWVTSYFAKRAGSWSGMPSYYARVLAAGAAASYLPAVLAGPRFAGALSLDQGLLLLGGAVLNLHHFILDGAIWKLRGPIGRILIRDVSEPPESPRPRRWPRRLVWSACAVGLAVQGFSLLVSQATSSALRRGDPMAAVAWLDRIDWVGLGSARERLRVAGQLDAVGDPAAARAQALRALALDPSWEAYALIGRTYLEEEAWPEAVQALDRAAELAPGQPRVLAQSGRAHALAGDLEEAQRRIRAAAALAPEDPQIRQLLRWIRLQTGQTQTGTFLP